MYIVFSCSTNTKLRQISSVSDSGIFLIYDGPSIYRDGDHVPQYDAHFILYKFLINVLVTLECCSARQLRHRSRHSPSMGWTAEWSEFEYRRGEKFSSKCRKDQFGANPASYPIGTGSSYLGGKGVGT
jgi:hypothetical protein